MLDVRSDWHVAKERAGRPKMSDEEKLARGLLVRRLRDRLGLTQEQVADRSHGKLKRTYVVKMESGESAFSSTLQIDGLGLAFDIASAHVQAYLDRAISEDQVVALRLTGGAAAKPQRDAAAQVAVHYRGATAEDIQQVIKEHPDAPDDPVTWFGWFCEPAKRRDDLAAEAASKAARREAKSKRAKAARARGHAFHGQRIKHGRDAGDIAAKRLAATQSAPPKVEGETAKPPRRRKVAH